MTARVSRLLVLLVVALLVPGGVLHAQLARPGHNAIESRLIAETDTPAAGRTVTLALVMRPDPGWHGYWKNPGDAGTETRLDWRLPHGVTAGQLRYPVPRPLLISGLMNYVFEGNYALLVDLDIPKNVAEGTRLPIAATARYLACTDRICVPESAELSLELIVGSADAPLMRRDMFDVYRAAMPRPLGSKAQFEMREGMLRIAVPIPAELPLDDPYFFPFTRDVVIYSAPQTVSRNGDTLVVEASANAVVPASMAGVLRIADGQGLEFVATPGPVPDAGTPLGSSAKPAMSSRLLITALLGAILGGLLLNIMPCVFPILSLKALSLARAGGDATNARHEALAYSAGVILTCLALGGLLLALRAGGASVGWAFQLQDPRVVLLLLLLVVAIALNLAGLFELPTIGGGDRLAARTGSAGAFWTGALAAFVATPCTGPFMAAALGAALLLPGPAALAVFAGLGLGLALPFLLLGFAPALRRRLPRPGPWMIRFKAILSIPMFLTAVALAWILRQEAGTAGLLLGLAAAITLAGALWSIGRMRGRARTWLALAPAAFVSLAAVLLIPTSAPAGGTATTLLAAEPFSEARLAALRAQNRSVFVYFTADWCLTCKVNEKAVLERKEVARSFAGRNVAVLVGDWTRGDPAISRFLEKQERSGVPLYLYYPPGKAAQILPQLLTVDRVTALAE